MRGSDRTGNEGKGGWYGRRIVRGKGEEQKDRATKLARAGEEKTGHLYSCVRTLYVCIRTYIYRYELALC